MDPADKLLDKIFSLVDLEKHSANELNELAAELEKEREAFNKSQVAECVVSAVGSAALIAAGLLIGGTALPFLAVVSMLAFGINEGSLDNKEKEIFKKIENLKKEIQTLTKSLADEGKEAGVPENAQEEYVTERIMGAMAKHFGLILDTKSSVASAALKQAVKITQRTFRIVFSGVELIYNSEIDKSKTLRERSEDMKAHAENIKKELDAIEHTLKEFAEVKKSIGSMRRSCRDKKTLIEFAKKQCKDAVRIWLEENEKTGAFLKLVDMFKFLKDVIDKDRVKIDQENIDIIFVAHGAIENPLIPASCLLPLPTIQDVVLYSPWNCNLLSDAAYGIATGRLEPRHRVFYCGEDKSCKVKHESHQPTKLPRGWNSMKDAGEREKTIPTISVSPLRIPEDGAWKHFEFLQDQHGRPGKNRILIPFILPGVSKSFRVPFFVITLALSLVLYFSRYKATVHLTACLGRYEKISDLSAHYLNHQYSYTIDETAMKSSEEMLDGTPLGRRFRGLFG